jgi:glycosyltransferase involved in cell wall biosynthesis
VADPGYWAGPSPDLPDGVVPLGPLPHRAVLRHVREAFAVFYPQARFEETFGPVFAEANAVGTPVLAHPHAVAREVLDETPADRRQLVDARDPEAAARRLTARFQTSRVAADWERRLGVESFPRVLRVPSEPAAAA